MTQGAFEELLRVLGHPVRRVEERTHASTKGVPHMKTYDTRKRCNIVWPEAEAPCGGRVLVQKTGRGEFRWEAYCDTCGLCDMDGYRTLKEAKRTDFFEKSRA